MPTDSDESRRSPASRADVTLESGGLGRRLLWHLRGRSVQENEAGRDAPTWEMVTAAEARAAAAETRIAQLESQLTEALARIAALEEENRKLRARLDRDSSNSSKPPSSDSPWSKAEGRRKKTRKRTGRKAGGQPGHKGQTRQMRPADEADEVHHRHPDECDGCGLGLGEADETGAPLAHQQYELPPLALSLIHFWLHRRRCPGCGRVTVAKLSKEEASGQAPASPPSSAWAPATTASRAG